MSLRYPISDSIQVEGKDTLALDVRSSDRIFSSSSHPLSDYRDSSIFQYDDRAAGNWVTALLYATSLVQHMITRNNNTIQHFLFHCRIFLRRC